MNKADKIAELKLANPTLTKGINGKTVEVSKTEYEEIINTWADMQVAEEEKKLEAEAKQLAKIATLEKLGITEEEAKTLLS